MKFSDSVTPIVKATLKQSFIGIWCHDNNLPFDEQEKIRSYFNRIFYYYRIFMDMKEFITYIAREPLAAKIFLIISDFTLYLSLIELAQRHSGLFEKVYLFLPTEHDILSPNVHLATSCRRRLFEELMKNILDYTVQENPSNIFANQTSLEIYSTSTTESSNVSPSIGVLSSKYQQNTPIRHVTKESLKFVCFLAMMDMLLQIEYNAEDISEMWIACRHLYEGNNVQLDRIDNLAKTYRKDEAVRYYTGNSCLPRVINQACHTEDIQRIFTFRVYISHLHGQLHAMNNQRIQNKLNTPDHIVFRGKLLSRSVVQQLMDNEGGLILLNGFLSTTFDPDVAVNFAGGTEANKENIPVTFLLHIDNTIKQPFVNISHCSTKPDESEILLSLGSIWRIESVKLDRNSCLIELKSCNELNSNVTELLEKYTREGCTLLSLGDILCEIGEDVEAEWFYRKMLEKDSLGDETRGILYYKIGMIRFEREDYFVALDNLERSAHLMEPLNTEMNDIATIQPLYMYNTRSPFLTIYNNMGLMLQNNNNSDAAIGCYKKALEERGSDFDRATVHNNLGILYFGRGDYSEAYAHHLQAVEFTDERHLYCAEFRRNLARIEKRFQHSSNNQKRKHFVTIVKEVTF